MGNRFGFNRPFPIHLLHTLIALLPPFVASVLAAVFYWGEDCWVRLANYHVAQAVICFIYMFAAVNYYRFLCSNQLGEEEVNFSSKKTLAKKQVAALMRDPSICLAVSNHVAVFIMLLLGLLVVTDGRVRYCVSFASYVIFWVVNGCLIFYFFTFQMSLLAGISMELYRIELNKEQVAYTGSSHGGRPSRPSGPPPEQVTLEPADSEPVDPNDPMSVYQQRSASSGVIKTASSAATKKSKSRGLEEPLLEDGDEAEARPSRRSSMSAGFKAQSKRIRERIMKQYGEDEESARQEALALAEEGQAGPSTSQA